MGVRSFARTVEGTYLSRLAREVVRALLSSGDTFVEVDVATVVGGEDGILEPSRVQQVDVELAVLAAFGDRNTLAHGSNVRIEDESHGRTILRDDRAHGPLRTASASIGDLPGRQTI